MSSERRYPQRSGDAPAEIQALPCCCTYPGQPTSQPVNVTLEGGRAVMHPHIKWASCERHKAIQLWNVTSGQSWRKVWEGHPKDYHHQCYNRTIRKDDRFNGDNWIWLDTSVDRRVVLTSLDFEGGALEVDELLILMKSCARYSPDKGRHAWGRGKSTDITMCHNFKTNSISGEGGQGVVGLTSVECQQQMAMNGLQVDAELHPETTWELDNPVPTLTVPACLATDMLRLLPDNPESDDEATAIWWKIKAALADYEKAARRYFTAERWAPASVVAALPLCGELVRTLSDLDAEAEKLRQHLFDRWEVD